MPRKHFISSLITFSHEHLSPFSPLLVRQLIIDQMHLSLASANFCCTFFFLCFVYFLLVVWVVAYFVVYLLIHGGVGEV